MIHYFEIEVNTSVVWKQQVYRNESYTFILKADTDTYA